MALTTAQLQTLKGDIAASEFGGLAHTSDNAFIVADAYNLQASPDFYVWRNGIPTKELKKSVDWVEYIGTSVGEKQAFELMIADGVVDAGDANIRQGFQDIFSGPQKQTTRTALVELSKRLVTRAEQVLATGGAGTNGDPATATFEGNLGYRDILNAWNS